VITPQPAKILWAQDEAASKYEAAGSLTANFIASGTGPAIQLAGVAGFQKIPIASDAGADAHAAAPALIDDGRILYFPDDTPAWCAFTLSDGKNVNAFVYARENAKPSVSTVNAPLSPEEIDRLIMEGTPPANNLGNLLDVLEPHLELNDFDAPVVNWQ